jgi:hypothetical protein
MWYVVHEVDIVKDIDVRLPDDADKKTATISAKVSPRDRERLAALAKERRWKISAYLGWLVEQHFAALDTHHDKSP